MDVIIRWGQEKAGPIDSRLRFALDPVAEFLGAAAYADECAEDNKKSLWIYFHRTDGRHAGCSGGISSNPSGRCSILR
jgi:hypothetical protein